jgi:lipopolysaccharide/colanic/teichoic acid biosynthesis glycosyltransferase
VGRVLRALHIDELPQLWNVLRGEMSLIGPRPERPEIAGKLDATVDLYDWRYSVKPGITGYAQINLPPDTTIASVRIKIELDRYYIRHQSIWLDIRIILCTALKILGLLPMRKWELDSQVEE